LELADLTKLELGEDEPEWHESRQALTRQGEPSLNLVCWTAEGPPPPGRNLEEIKALLCRSVRLTGGDLVRELPPHLQQPSGWRDSALLRNHYLLEAADAVPTPVDCYLITVDPSLGVEVKRS
jgi:hypothetical protein